MTKLSASLPDDHGLGAIRGVLVDEPERVHAALVLIDTQKITEEIDTGERVATVRIRQIEVIGGDDLEWVGRAFRRAREARTGQAVLPIELELELDAIDIDIALPDEDE